MSDCEWLAAMAAAVRRAEGGRSAFMIGDDASAIRAAAEVLEALAKEPTNAMIGAGIIAAYYGKYDTVRFRRAWDAMLAALLARVAEP